MCVRSWLGQVASVSFLRSRLANLSFEDLLGVREGGRVCRALLSLRSLPKSSCSDLGSTSTHGPLGRAGGQGNLADCQRRRGRKVGGHQGPETPPGGGDGGLGTPGAGCLLPWRLRAALPAVAGFSRVGRSPVLLLKLLQEIFCLCHPHYDWGNWGPGA